MKNSIRLDVVSANDMLLDKQSKQKKPNASKRKTANQGDARNIVDALGSPWAESSWGAEITSSASDASAKANIYKKQDDTYSVKLSVDVASLNSLKESSPEDCIKNILSGIDSVADVCSQLSRAIAKSDQSDLSEVKEIISSEEV